MEKLEIASMGARGQIVIPFDIRQQMGLTQNEKFVVVCNKDTILLKKVTPPSFDNFDELIQKTREFAKKNNITKKDLDSAIKRART